MVDVNSLYDTGRARVSEIIPDPKSVQTALRVPGDVLARIDNIALQRGRTRSRVIVEILRAALDMPEQLPQIARVEITERV